MATTTEPYLEITDTVTSCKIMDNTLTTVAQKRVMPYRLSYDTWAPKIAQRNKGPFGLPYLPVLEEMIIDVCGSTAADAMTKLQTLNTLIDQGERWFNNEIVLPVFIRYQPKGSTKTTYMKDVIIGRGMGDQSDLMGLSSNFNIVGENYWITGIRVKFWRRNGVWLCESEAQSVSTVAQPGPITVTWSDFAPVLSPIDIQIGPNVDAAGDVDGFLVVTHDNRYLSFIAGTALTSSSTGTATADASKLPTNTNVMRFTVSLANPDFGVADISAAAMKECEYVAVYVKVRNNSSTVDCYMWLELGGVSAQPTPETQEVKIARSSGTIAVFLGIFPTRGRDFVADEILIRMRVLSGSITIDIDEVMVVGINRSTNVLAYSSTLGVLGASSGNYILSRLLVEPQGILGYGAPPNDLPMGYTGSIYCFTGSNGTVKKTSMAYFFTEDANYWNASINSHASKQTINTTVTRYKAYLTPE